jgi:hypothetical protein
MSEEKKSNHWVTFFIDETKSDQQRATRKEIEVLEEERYVNKIKPVFEGQIGDLKAQIQAINKKPRGLKFYKKRYQKSMNVIEDIKIALSEEEKNLKAAIERQASLEQKLSDLESTSAFTNIQIQGAEDEYKTFINNHPIDPLIHAVINEDEETVQKLLKNVSNLVNRQDPETGFTPLHWAVELNNEKITKLILRSKEADVTLKTATGKTAAELTDNPQIRELFSEYENISILSHLHKCK